MSKTRIYIHHVTVSAVPLFFLMFFQSAGAASRESCGTVQISSANGTCSSLTVRINVSDCEGGRPLRTAEVNCQGNAATAQAKTSAATYSVGLKLEKDSWGASQWVQDGDVTREVGKSSRRMSKTIADKPQTVRNAAPAAPAAAAPVVAPSSPSETGFNLAFAFDGYYAYNFNRPRPFTAGSTLPAGNIGTRYFDIYHNQFALNLAELSISRTGKEVGFVLDLDFGQFADQNGMVFPAAVGDEVSKHVGQAYVTYSPSKLKGLTFDFGKLPTHVGLELLKAKDNWQYSRSTVFGFAIPAWHTGLHIGYATSPLLTVGLYLYNGWNSIYDNNGAKTVGAQLRFAPSDTLVALYNVITGPEQAGNNQNYTTVHEANITYTPTQNFAVALEAVTGWEEGYVDAAGADASSFWHAATLATRHQISSRYYLSPRIEIFRDGLGYRLQPATPTPQTMYTFTLTNGINLAPGYDFRLEFRHDKAGSDAQFVTGTGTSATQTTLAAAFIVSL